ncbi:MAG TPA: patatin-like phospholipase family protein, partial [Acidimicrobiales bacterium]|nr:patatin-like phospholipase family protein [Acidimicrobiales bacterium]
MSKDAFVLAGGGTKGAFEAGAIRYLVEEEAITPEVITATSAGSLCAAVLAQARGHQELVERAQELHDDLLAMTHTDLLFGKQPWLAALEGTLFGRAVDGYVVERTRPPIPGMAADVVLASGPAVGRR